MSVNTFMLVCLRVKKMKDSKILMLFGVVYFFVAMFGEEFGINIEKINNYWIVAVVFICSGIITKNIEKISND